MSRLKTCSRRRINRRGAVVGLSKTRRDQWWDGVALTADIGGREEIKRLVDRSVFNQVIYLITLLGGSINFYFGLRVYFLVFGRICLPDF